MNECSEWSGDLEYKPQGRNIIVLKSLAKDRRQTSINHPTSMFHLFWSLATVKVWSFQGLDTLQLSSRMHLALGSGTVVMFGTLAFGLCLSSLLA